MMERKTLLPLVVALGMIQFAPAKRPIHTSSWDFHGELHLEMSFTPPPWYSCKAKTLNGVLEDLTTSATPGISHVPFVSGLPEGFAEGVSGNALNQINIPIPIHIQDIKLHQYKDGTFTFFIEHFCSVLNDKLDLRLRMPFVGYPLKEIVHITCKGIKLSAYINENILKVETLPIDVQGILDHALPDAQASTSTDSGAVILAEHASSIIENLAALPFTTTSVARLLKGCCIPIRAPAIANTKIQLKNWHLDLVKVQKGDETDHKEEGSSKGKSVTMEVINM
jgi:hypothetical protein